MVPADNADEIGLRDVINDEEVEEVFAVLRKKEARMPTNWSRRFKNHVEKLKSGDIYQVAEVVRNLSIREADKGLSAGEKRMLARARQILVSELTFALNVDEEAAEARLDAVLRARTSRRRSPRSAPPPRSSPRAWAASGASSSPPGRGDRFGAAQAVLRPRRQRVSSTASWRLRRRSCDGVVVVLPAGRRRGTARRSIAAVAGGGPGPTRCAPGSPRYPTTPT